MSEASAYHVSLFVERLIGKRMDRRFLPAMAWASSLASLLPAGQALADVTIQQETTINTSLAKAHGTSTDRIAGDKQRNERQFSCDGVMSMFCGHNTAVDIVRLDRGVTWSIEPKKKRYTEIPLPTPEERRAQREHEQAVLEKLASCPRPTPATSDVDGSQCEMSSPVFAVNRTQDITTLIGHSAQRTNVSMTQSCKVKSSADVCTMAYSFDVWLTQDDLPGLSDRVTFEKARQRKLGESGGSVFNSAEMGPLLAQYSGSLGQLSAKAASFKGYPLKTTFRFAMGGAHCGLVPGGGVPHAPPEGSVSTATAAAGEAGANSAQHAVGWGASDAVQHATGSSIGGYVAGSAAGAFTQNLVAGLFKRKKADPASSGTPSSGSPPPGSDEKAMTTVAEISVETTAIDPAPIAADQFEVPEGWKKLSPKSTTAGEPSCPAAH
jgi:hypothetical protein